METTLRKRRRELALRHYHEACSRLKPAVDFLYGNGATEVYLFGSITNKERFTEHSDIDIAVKGISEDKQLDIEGKLSDILQGIEYDLVFWEENIRIEIRQRIEKEAILWKP